MKAHCFQLTVKIHTRVFSEKRHEGKRLYLGSTWAESAMRDLFGLASMGQPIYEQTVKKRNRWILVPLVRL